MIQETCERLRSLQTRGELGAEVAALVLAYTPRDLDRMRWNFTGKAGSVQPEYIRDLEKMITAYLHGTYQDIRLMQQQGAFAPMHEPLLGDARKYWTMVAGQCTGGDEESDRLRFLKFLLAGFSMLVRKVPGHPVGTPFPGGDRVQMIDSVYYCPVREKANEVDSALCPFCPALQTPEIGYLKPPVDGSRHRKQEFIRQCYDHHHFNG